METIARVPETAEVPIGEASALTKTARIKENPARKRRIEIA
jgi:hypothetical protein